MIWNLDKVLDDKSPQFDKRQIAQVKTRLPSIASWKKLDDMTVEITTKDVNSFFPYQMLWFLVSSPAQYEKLGKDWDKFAIRAVRYRPVQARQARAARARRTGEERRLLGQDAARQRSTGLFSSRCPKR